jgi:hypothetical protein
MGQGLHGRATMAQAIQRAMQISRESLRALAKRYVLHFTSSFASLQPQHEVA